MSEIVIKDLKTNTIVPDFEYDSQSLRLPNAQIQFITGQRMKYEELKDQIRSTSIALNWLKIDTEEIQDCEPENIVQKKCIEALKNVQGDTRIIMVEDVSLNFKGMNDLPGPYIKWFLDRLGPEGLVKMLSGFEDKRAQAVCIYGILYNNHIAFCRGVVEGQIVAPRGKGGWGWDSIFEESGTKLTYSEMGEDMKRVHSHRAKAVVSLNEFFDKFASR